MQKYVRFNLIVYYREELLVNCSNIGDIVIGEKLGEGWKREVFAGDFHGRKVAVKIVHYDGEQYKQCISDQVRLNVSNSMLVYKKLIRLNKNLICVISCLSRSSVNIV